MSPAQAKNATPLSRQWTKLRALHERQRRHVYNELAHANGLLHVLMKRRNGVPWTTEEREALRQGLSRLSPYLIPLLMPGGFLMLPAVAWWLDRRRRKRPPETP